MTQSLTNATTTKDNKYVRRSNTATYQSSLIMILLIQSLLLLMSQHVASGASTHHNNPISNMIRSNHHHKQTHRSSWWHTNKIGKSTISAFHHLVIRKRGGSSSTNDIMTPPMDHESRTSSSSSTELQQSKMSGPDNVQYNIDYDSNSIDAGSTSMEILLEKLQTSIHYGLTSEQVATRQKQYGLNSLPKSKPKSLLSLIIEQFQDRLVQILVVVAIISSIFSLVEVIQEYGQQDGGSIWKYFVEPFVIIAILVCNAAVGIWQTQSASNSIEALQSMQASVSCVIRDNIVIDNENASSLVPGDIIIIRTGDKVPADGRIISIQTALLNIDETSLTGESVTVSKLSWNDGTNTIYNAPIQDQRGLVYSGTVVTRGTAKMVVTATGTYTQFGKIQQGVVIAQQDIIQTPLTIKLNEFANQLTTIIGIICLCVWIINIPKMNDNSFDYNFYKGAIYYIKVAIALGVAAIPEGLPAVITLCLSLSTRRMANENNVIVRKLPSIETLGCTTVICTDKTGTLTTNEMTAVRLITFQLNNDHNDDNKIEYNNYNDKINASEYIIEGSSYSPIGIIDGISNNYYKESGSIADIAAVSALCNDAKIIGNDIDINNNNTEIGTKLSKKKNDIDKPKKIFERVGEPTEAALCVLAEKIGNIVTTTHNNDVDNVSNSILASANVNQWREQYPRLATLDFNRDRKSMSVIVKSLKDNKNNKNRLLVKGAPNLLLDRCSHIKLIDGTIVKLNNPIRQLILNKISELAARPLRCIALAIKEHEQLDESLQNIDIPLTTNNNDELSSSTNTESSGIDLSKHPLLCDPNNYQNIESGLTLVGIVGIKDPARPGVADSIKQCTKAGIRVIMITGDAKDTAIAIAKDVNIFPPSDDNNDNMSSSSLIKAYEGREFFAKSSRDQLDILKEGNIVFCRAEPSDKQRLIQILQRTLGEVTAMTGDGVNDAPALQQASIGISMGITGTEVAKEASDMILTDDNFSTIVQAVKEGRRIYANMQAFICFLISCNIGEICAIFFATLAGFPEPLTAMHLLWINLVTDGPPATALGFNPPSPDIMDMPPRPTDEPIMTRWLLTRYCITGLYVGLATIGIFAQHYISQGISLAELASWSQCGVFWSPKDIISGDNNNGIIETIHMTCNDLFQGRGRMLPQTLALTTLVCMEMIKALCAVSVDNSIFRVGPQDNPWLLLAVAGPMLLHIFVIYSSYFGLPAIGESLGLVSLSVENWINILCWAVPILLVDEILKAIGRWLYREERAKKAKLFQASKAAL